MSWLLKAVTGNPMLLVWIALGAFAAGVVSGGGAAWTVQGWRLAAVKAEYDSFVAQTKTLGDAAAAKAKTQEAADKQRKEQADVQHKKDLAAIASLSRRLRDARASSNYVPAASPYALHPDTACFVRPELERAIQQLDAGVQGLIDQSDQARVGLDTAKTWAQGVKP